MPMNLTDLNGNVLLNGIDPDTGMTDEVLQSQDMTEFTKCVAAIAARNSTVAQHHVAWPNSNDLASVPEPAAKTFHPRTGGYRATRDEILDKLRYQQVYLGGPPTKDQKLRIMAIGDDLTYGESNDWQSYREELWNILTAGQLFDLINPSVWFMGSKSPPGGPRSPYS